MADDDLDALLADARALRPEPSADLVARILADAERCAPVAASRPGWRDWLAALGGWPSLGGLAAATVAGFWIGMAPPAALQDLAARMTGEAVSVSLGADDDPLALLGG